MREKLGHLAKRKGKSRLGRHREEGGGNAVVEEKYKEHWDDSCPDGCRVGGYELAVECSPDLGGVVGINI